MEAYFMGIDTGTQGVRIGISDTRGKLIFEPEELRSRKLPQVVSSAWRAFAPVISISPLEQSSFSLYMHFTAEHFRIVIVSYSSLDFVGLMCPYLSIRKKNKNIQKTA